MMLTVKVPGRFAGDAAFVDLETEKVPCDYVMVNGERLRNRWSVIMAGVARSGEIKILVREDGAEAALLAGIAEAIGDGEVVYAGTREFDEMILRGRFTNARRAHAPVPFFPAMPGANELAWYNCHKAAKALTEYRADDVPSRDVPAAYYDERYDLVLIHLLRDVCELILAAGAPDAACRNWCRLILADLIAAYDALTA
jgi:hypothetical protein